MKSNAKLGKCLFYSLEICARSRRNELAIIRIGIKKGMKKMDIEWKYIQATSHYTYKTNNFTWLVRKK